jgi:hypothetical protein
MLIAVQMSAAAHTHEGVPMSRIYLITHTNPDADTPSVVRFVRAQSKNGAVRAVAAELFHVELASTDDIMAASAAGSLDILDAMVEAADAADPGPVPGMRP